MPTRQLSHAWALHAEASAVPLQNLSENALSGLDYARELAADAKERSRQNVLPGESFAPLTIAELAARDDYSTSTVRRWIRQARYELFGNISDNAIYKRLQRERHQGQRKARLCQQPGCEQPLTPHTHASRLYCDDHRTSAQRVRRHRQQRT